MKSSLPNDGTAAPHERHSWQQQRRRKPPVLARWALLVAGAITAGHAPGCRLAALPGPPPYQVVLAPGYHPTMYRRVLFLPVIGLEGDPVAATLVSDALLAELQTVGPFEVIVPEPIAGPACPDGPPPPLTPDDVAQLVEQYRPDAVLFTTVTSYMPYPPIELGLSIRLVRAWDQQTLASIDTVRVAPEDIPFSNGDCTLAHPADDLLLADAAVAACSPRHFARYVAMHVAHALALDPLTPPANGSNWSILRGPGRLREWF